MEREENICVFFAQRRHTSCLETGRQWNIKCETENEFAWRAETHCAFLAPSRCPRVVLAFSLVVCWVFFGNFLFFSFLQFWGGFGERNSKITSNFQFSWPAGLPIWWDWCESYVQMLQALNLSKNSAVSLARIGKICENHLKSAINRRKSAKNCFSLFLHLHLWALACVVVVFSKCYLCCSIWLWNVACHLYTGEENLKGSNGYSVYLKGSVGYIHYMNY